MFLWNGLLLVELSFCKQEGLTDHCRGGSVHENIKKGRITYIYISSETREMIIPNNNKLIIPSLPGQFNIDLYN